MWWLAYLPLKFAQAVSNCSPGDPGCTTGQTNLPQVAASSDTLKLVLQLVFGIIGALTVIFIIINALRYSTSLGDPQANAKIRNSLIYAAVGLAVVVSAEVIVTFVLGRL
jgi:hypothetical protein